MPIATYASPDSVPIAARSESATDSALRPTSLEDAVLRRKWTPSTSMSTEVAVAPDGTLTAASSPIPSTSCSLPETPDSPIRSASLAISSNSPPGRMRGLSMPGLNRLARHPVGELEGRQRQGAARQPRVAGDRGERQCPDQVPGNEPRRRDEKADHQRREAGEEGEAHGIDSDPGQSRNGARDAPVAGLRLVATRQAECLGGLTAERRQRRDADQRRGRESAGHDPGASL